MLFQMGSSGQPLRISGSFRFTHSQMAMADWQGYSPDLALAQDEHTGTRGYAMSQSILQQRTEYYAVLESMQQGDLDVT